MSHASRRRDGFRPVPCDVRLLHGQVQRCGRRREPVHERAQRLLQPRLVGRHVPSRVPGVVLVVQNAHCRLDVEHNADHHHDRHHRHHHYNHCGGESRGPVQRQGGSFQLQRPGGHVLFRAGVRRVPGSLRYLRRRHGHLHHHHPSELLRQVRCRHVLEVLRIVVQQLASGAIDPDRLPDHVRRLLVNHHWHDHHINADLRRPNRSDRVLDRSDEHGVLQLPACRLPVERSRARAPCAPLHPHTALGIGDTCRCSRATGPPCACCRGCG